MFSAPRRGDGTSQNIEQEARDPNRNIEGTHGGGLITVSLGDSCLRASPSSERVPSVSLTLAMLPKSLPRQLNFFVHGARPWVVCTAHLRVLLTYVFYPSNNTCPGYITEETQLRLKLYIPVFSFSKGACL